MSNQKIIEMDNPNTVCPKVQMAGYGEYTGEVIWGELVMINFPNLYVRIENNSPALKYDALTGLPDTTVGFEKSSGFIVNITNLIFTTEYTVEDF